MSSFNIVCDNCGRLVQGVTWMNGMKFCAKCYQKTFGAEQQQRIAELEEQLKKMTPKFKVGQKIYMADCKEMSVFSATITKTILTLHRENEHIHMYDIIKDIEPDWICGTSEEWLFATKEEAQAKLEELQKLK